MNTELLPDLNSTCGLWLFCIHQQTISLCQLNCLQFCEDILNWDRYSILILKYPTFAPCSKVKPRNHPSKHWRNPVLQDKKLLNHSTRWLRCRHLIAYTNLESAFFQRHTKHILLRRSLHLWLFYLLLQTQLSLKMYREYKMEWLTNITWERLFKAFIQNSLYKNNLSPRKILVSWWQCGTLNI